MPNPFNREPEPVEELEEVEGFLGCYADGCGKVVGEGLYDNAKEILYYTCPAGHKNEVSIKL